MGEERDGAKEKAPPANLRNEERQDEATANREDHMHDPPDPVSPE